MPCRSEGSVRLERAVACAHRVVPARQSGVVADALPGHIPEVLRPVFPSGCGVHVDDARPEGLPPYAGALLDGDGEHEPGVSGLQPVEPVADGDAFHPVVVPIPVERGDAQAQSGFPESLYWRRLGRRYELLGLASWIVAAVAVVVFVAVLIAARDLLVPAVLLVPLARVMVLVVRLLASLARSMGAGR